MVYCVWVVCYVVFALCLPHSHRGHGRHGGHGSGHGGGYEIEHAY